jgi:hypothetical protein
MQQITIFIDLQDQLNMFRKNIFPSSGAWDRKLQHVVWCPVVVVGWRSGGRQRGTMCLVWRKMPDFMLSWSWRSINTDLLHLVGLDFITLPAVVLLPTRNVTKFKILYMQQGECVPSKVGTAIPTERYLSLLLSSVIMHKYLLNLRT